MTGRDRPDWATPEYRKLIFDHMSAPGDKRNTVSTGGNYAYMAESGVVFDYCLSGCCDDHMDTFDEWWDCHVEIDIKPEIISGKTLT